MRWFDKFFEEDEEEQEAKATTLRRAEEILEFSRLPFYARFLDELSEEADVPLAVGEQARMIEQAVRANTLRDLRRRLIQRVKQAEGFMRDFRESQNG